MAHRLASRLRESVAATQLPQLQRDQDRDRLEESVDRDNHAYQQGHADRKAGKPRLSRKQFNAAHPGHDADDYPLYQAGYDADRGNLKLVPKKKTRESFRLLLREATVTKKGGAYEATIVREGPGNPADSNYYTREALREAVNRGLFEGLQAYANHPTASEERERPERDVRALVGHFREARFIDAHPAEVRAKFLPVSGPGYEWVTSLIESALAAPKGRPLIGISIDGYGHAPDQENINGRTYNMVREVTHLGSADIVTRAGAGGMFHRRLQEAWRTHTPAVQAGASTSKEVRMKPAKLQEKVKDAVAKLREASSVDCEDGRADVLLTEALDTLQKLTEAKLTTKQRKKLPKSDFAVPSKGSGSGSYPIPDESHARDALARVAANGTPEEQEQVKAAVRKKFPDIKVGGSKKSREADTGDPDMPKNDELAIQLREATERAEKAERKLAKVQSERDMLRSSITANKVLRESGLPDKSREALFDELLAAGDETSMQRLVEREKAVRDELITELRETAGIEGAGPRHLTLTAPNNSAAVGLLERVGIDRDELAGS